MTLSILLLLTLYTIIVVSLIWARFRFFKIYPGASRISSIFYDPTVVIHILATYYYMIVSPVEMAIYVTLAAAIYMISLLLFWWSLRTAKQLDFAFSKNVGEIITNGPFGFIRHPFYVSYVLCWLTSSLLFNSYLLWITLTYLIFFYFISARREENVILKSTHSKEYASYKKEIGMFLPRVTQWKSWFIGKSNPKAN